MPSLPLRVLSTCLALLAVTTAVDALAAAAEPNAASPASPQAPVVPAVGLRELSTDRPDATESPFTVDAGHTQLEMDFTNVTLNHLDGVRTREWEVAPFNLRVGLRDDWEVGIFVTPYVHATEKDRSGGRSIHRGFGDVTLRTKINFWGNNGGPSAGGLIADLKLPTARGELGNGAVEGAVILPYARELAGGWELGAMTGGELHHRESGGSRPVWINTVTVGHDIARDLGGYVELTSSAGEGAHVALIDVGVTWKLDANTQLDAGANLGISRSADDAQFFAGVSRRF